MFLFIVMMMFGCETEQEKNTRLEDSRYRHKCVSKSSGSQPECWDEKDWEKFCQKVRCK
jgi:hypothetical protein